MPAVPSSTWIDRHVAIDLQHLAVAHRVVGERDRHEFIPANAVDAGDHQQEVRAVRGRPCSRSSRRHSPEFA